MMINPETIFDLDDSGRFETVCLDIFKHQALNCEIYARYLDFLRLDIHAVQLTRQIPFLPIEFFKTQRIISAYAHNDKTRKNSFSGNDCNQGITFTSSGTTGTAQSRHEVLDLGLYQRSFRDGFNQFYGDPADLAILALLPSYQERQGSSLIYMVNDLIEQSRQPESGYFLHDDERLYTTLLRLQSSNTPTLLLGVTYALLDFAEKYRIKGFQALRIMETGGMKGRRHEMIREEVHDLLKAAFGTGTIHSEYGMTELLSQAYSDGEGLFSCPPWMKILIRDTNDPFAIMDEGRTGGVNVIDLANLHSCSFIATQDLGRIHRDGRFEIIGRFDHSDIRGCNLLIT